MNDPEQNNGYIKDGVVYLYNQPIGKVEDVRDSIAKVLKIRRNILKQFNTEELIDELKSRGINVQNKCIAYKTED